jgi:CBS domain-containing protein
MTTVADILKAKGSPAVHGIEPTATVFDAVKLMAQKDIGAVLIMENDRIVGIFSERDYARKLALAARSSKETQLREVMTTSVIYVRPNQTSEDCMALMTQNRLRHLPVMDGERVVGLISIGDLVKNIISEQQFIIAQLEHYIAGEPR